MIARHLPTPRASKNMGSHVRPMTEVQRGDDEVPSVVKSIDSKLRPLLWCVALVAAAISAFNLSAFPLWFYPDSIDYIDLAGKLLSGLDLTDELYLIRTPAYPFLLAATFAVFGSWSPDIILVMQHVMGVGIAVLTAATAWRLTESRLAVILSGLLCAASLQVLAYTNLLLTEIPFTLIVAAVIDLLVRYTLNGARRDLAWAAALCGAAYLFRPIGLCLIGPCLLAVALRSRADHNRLLAADEMYRWRRSRPTLGRSAFIGLAFVFIPAALVAGPWMVWSRSLHHGSQAARCLDYVLYLRAASFDGLDSSTSAALSEIKTVLAEAQSRGAVSPEKTYRDRPAVEHAFRAVRGAGFAQTSEVMGRAGRDLMREHPGPTIANTFRYAAWMLLEPDPVYRFVPGGSPGRNGGRAKGEATYDIGTYSVGDGSWERRLETHVAYLPLDPMPRWATPAWTSVVDSFRVHVGDGAWGIPFVDSPFAAAIYFCAGCGLFKLRSRQRSAWLVAISVVASHVLLSAFLAGPLARYAVAVKPALLMFGAVGVSAIIVSLAGWTMRARRLSHLGSTVLRPA